MNIPYGCVMVAVNESLKRTLRPAGDYDTQTFLLAGSGAGAVAAAATNPLDVVKTRLQTQALRAPAPSAAAAAVAVAGAKGEGVQVGARGGITLPQFLRASGSGAATGGGVGGAAGQHGPVLGGVQGTGIHSAAARCATGRCGAEKPVVTLQYQGLLDAVSRRFLCWVDLAPSGGRFAHHSLATYLFQCWCRNLLIGARAGSAFRCEPNGLRESG